MLKKKKSMIALSFLAILVLLLATWSHNYVHKRDTIKEKLHIAIENAGQAAQYAAEERVFTNIPKSASFYASNMNDVSNQAVMQQQLLTTLMNDQSMPAFKLTHFSIYQMQSVQFQASVQFATLFGIQKSLTVSQTVPLVRFQHETGTEILEGRY
ncbi:hypothetical protein [Paenibacillus sp. NPDC058071]|uniref:hypothetical protein n=1 Tax=Paenibacillus sp. NPDC058071 TaxID=3346326 RepID=UPI0036DA682E